MDVAAGRLHQRALQRGHPVGGHAADAAARATGTLRPGNFLFLSLYRRYIIVPRVRNVQIVLNFVIFVLCLAVFKISISNEEVFYSILIGAGMHAKKKYLH